MIQHITQTLSNRAVHKQVLLLAIPMVLSNITVPLLGLVDAAVIGHLEHAWYLGGGRTWRYHDQCNILAARLLAHVDHWSRGTILWCGRQASVGAGAYTGIADGVGFCLTVLNAACVGIRRHLFFK